MRTEIFNGNTSINRPKLTIRSNRKKYGFRLILIALVIIITSVMGCSDGAITAYMDYKPNSAPQILELKSDYTGSPVPGDIVTITCTTHDPDGNPLTYNFTSPQGSFTDQADREGRSEITFIVGNIAGGEDVNVTVTVTDSKDASASATLNVGKSSMGPVITLEGPGHRTSGADGYSAVTFRSNMDGYYQVGLAGDGTAEDTMDPERSLFIVKKNSDTVFTICGPTDSDIINEK
jgi:hypothetical protein